ncbi:hypothetical protein BC830DRAFT_1258017 [Chytriomyces sp. MP71]|nr:hypothetical protein BC830DRAFT_1258017 [Chytriomyces sp. MP71]
MEWGAQYDHLREMHGDAVQTVLELKTAAKAQLDTAPYTARVSQLLSALRDGLGALEAALGDAEARAMRPPTELRRYEQDMLALSKDVDHLERMAWPARDPEQARKELLQSRLQKQKGSSSSSGSAAAANASGTAASLLANTRNSASPYPSTASSSVPEEDLTSGELLQLHNRMIDDQDSHLDALSNAILRQKQIGIQIGEELDYHVELLQQTDTVVENTQDRLGNVNRRLGEVSIMSGTDYRANLCIIVLVGILVLIVFS